MSSSSLAGTRLRERSVASAFGERVLRAFVIGIPLVYVIAVALAWNHVGPRDLDQFVVFHQLQLWNAELFGFAKQWSPVLCSGVSLAGEPQVPLLSLSMLIAYFFGPLRGLQGAMLIYLVVGWVGAYLYGGLWLEARRTRVLAASLFIGNGFFVCRIAYGHMDFLPFLALPLALWSLHDVIEVVERSWSRRFLHIALLTLLMGACVSIAVDGSPVSIIHLLFWIGLYAVVLSVVRRSVVPTAIVGAAVAVAAFLDAGYLWPMLEAQGEFPRQTPDTFTNPLALAWFALLPVRGKLITPATGNGHELSVFIGPIAGYAIWRFRASLPALPKDMKWPLLVVSVASIWLGMGSLKVLHIPALFSPFDWLRPLPGFRSLWVTGRFWGFLTLPLSLLGAAALVQFVASDIAPKKKKIALALALAMQFSFQTITLYSLWNEGHSYRPAAPQPFARAGETIRYAECNSQHYQGEFITPTQGVINCYDNDDFIRVRFYVGAPLAQSVRDDSGRPIAGAAVDARFMSWNRIHVDVPPSKTGALTLVFNQAYNAHWSSPDCTVQKEGEGFLAARCPRLGPNNSIELSFDDELSTTAAHVSVTSWRIWSLAFALLAVVWGLLKRVITPSVDG